MPYPVDPAHPDTLQYAPTTKTFSLYSIVMSLSDRLHDPFSP